MNNYTCRILLAYKRGYRVLDDGRVLSSRNKVLKPSKCPQGYLSFSLKMPDRKSRRVKVHRLMAYQKYGDAIFVNGVEAGSVLV